MAHVKVHYIVDDCDSVDERFLEGDYKRVSWDGLVLKAGNKTIYSAAYFESQEEKDGILIPYGATDIWSLEIDGHVFIKEDE